MKSRKGWLAVLPLGALIVVPRLASAPIAAAPPAITAISPAVVPAGAPAFRIKVEGSHFTRVSYVRWNGAMRPTIFDRASTLYADIPATDLATTRTAQVTVMNPDDGAASNPVVFTIGNPVPTIIGLTPPYTPLYGEPLTLTVYGSKFVPGSVIHWNGTARLTTYVDATHVKMSVAASDLTVTGGQTTSTNVLTTNVTVVNPAPGGGTSAIEQFGLLILQPSISSIWPPQLPAGTSAFTMRVNGQNFVRAVAVLVNGVARPTTWVSSTALDVAIPASDVATAGTYPIRARLTVPNHPVQDSPPTTLTVLGTPTLTMPSSISVMRYSTAPLSFTGDYLSSIVAKVNGTARRTSVSNMKTLTVVLDSLDVATTQALALTVDSYSPTTTRVASATINVVNPQPSLASITVQKILPDGGIVVLVRGGYLVPETVVRVNGLARATTMINRTSLQTTIRSTDFKPGAPASIRLYSPGPGGGSSAALSFGGT